MTPCDRLIQVKTIERVLLGLHNGDGNHLIDRGDRLIEVENYSRSREEIFGTLKTDQLIEGDHLICAA